MKTPGNDAEYQQLLSEIEAYIQKATALGGFENLSKEEGKTLAELARSAEAYEDSIPLMPIKAPLSIPEMISFKMYERKLNQREMARLLGIAEARLSEVLHGKRKVSLDLAKQLYLKLGIDAGFILEHA